MLLPIELVELSVSKLNGLSPFVKLQKELNCYYLKKLIRKNKLPTQIIYENACKHGVLKLLSTFNEVVEVGSTENAILLASKYGHLNVVKYLNEVVEVGSTENAMVSASNRGHLEVIRYLHEVVGLECNYPTRLASENGHLEVVDYLDQVVGSESTHLVSHLEISYRNS